MRALAEIAAVTGMVALAATAGFVVYAATAVVYGAPLLFVLWLTGAL